MKHNSKQFFKLLNFLKAKQECKNIVNAYIKLLGRCFIQRDLHWIVYIGP